METYIRSVLFRLAGAIAGGAIWIGLIVLALANFDTPVGLPEDLRATWPFWLVALVVVLVVYLVRRRIGPGPGWGAFGIGFFAPLVALFANANLGDGGGIWFWIPIVVMVLVPLPIPSRSAVS
ncbi:MAG TPA: hypothetical protein VJ948_10020 [Acidimicrobiia bacterium]|nr:hypothetical protein [Acidimicrobiia bacterium]